MGRDSGFQPKLFYHNVNLEKRIPANHILRKIRDIIDFNFIYRAVKATYGDNGRSPCPHRLLSSFERIVWHCVEAGLVDGSMLFIDLSLIDADASNTSAVDTHSLKRYLKKGYQQLEKRLDELIATKATPANSSHISPTDPDAWVTRHGSGTSKLSYKTHQAVDPRFEVTPPVTYPPGRQMRLSCSRR